MTNELAEVSQQVVDDLQRRLDESLAQQAATADVLKIISRSTFDIQTVLETLIKSAVELSGVNRGSIFLREGDVFPLKAASSTTPEFLQYWAANPPKAGRGSATSRVIASGKIEVIPDVLEDPDMEMSAGSLNKIRAALGVPMLRHDKVEGVIVLTRPEPGPFSKSQIDLVQTFADQAMIAIENARLFNEVQAKTADLQESLQHQTATSEVLQVISRSPGELDPVFQTILASATSICDAQFGLLVLYEDGGFRCTSTFNLPPAFAETFLRNPVIYPPPIDPLGRVIETRQLVHVVDVKQEPAYLTGFPPIVELVELGGARTLLLVPMLKESGLVGVVAIFRQTVHAFSDKQIDLVTSFGNQAVIAIENAHLLNETNEALEQQIATAEVLRVIASSPTDVKPVLDVIVESACKLCEASDAYVALKDGDNLVFQTHHGSIPVAWKRRPINRQWPAGRAVVDGKYVHLRDVLAHEGDEFPEGREIARHDGARSVLTVPLMREGGSIGVIILRRTEVLPFTDKQIALLQIFADQAIIAIQNARLFNETREALERQTATADILKVIASSPSNVQPVFEAIAERSKRLVDALSTTVFRLEDGVMHLKAFTSTNPEADATLQAMFPAPLSDFSWGEAIGRGEIHRVVDTELEIEGMRELARLRGYRSMLFVPLLRDRKPIGVIAVTREEPGPFIEHHVQLLQTFADQAVIAIENVRLFDEVQARTDDLRESLQQQTATADVLKVISRSAFDLKSVLTTLTESAKSLCGASLGIICLRDGEVMRLQAESGCTQAFVDFMQANPIKPGRETITGRVFMDGRPVHVADVQLDAEYRFGSAPTIGAYRAVLAVPLMRDGAVEGVLLLGRPEPGPFSQRQIDLVQTFADQAVIAIENVRLFDEVQARTHDLTEALQFQTATSDVLKVISSSPDTLQPVLDVIVETSRHLCNAVTSSIFLLRDGRFHIAALSGAAPEHLGYVQANPIAPEQRGSSTARAAREKRTVHIPDISADPEFGEGHMAVGHRRALLSVPLMRDGVAIGIITMGQSYLTPFTERQIEVVRTFADQAVIALSNVRLFEQVQERTRELSLSLDELRTAQDRLIQTEKLASLGQLTAGIAHEIKNPLNFVNNFSALSGELIDELNDLLKQAALDAHVRGDVDELTGMLKGNLEKVVQHGKRADSIVKNMLLHSREGSGDRRAADINTIVEESLNLAYHGARAEKSGFNITLERDLDPSAGVIDLYPQEITRVFLNLISNGFYAANKRKEAGDDGFEPLLTATTKNLGSKVEIRIRDNGTGIPAEVKEKMFNPFFTTKPAGEGTGLGLSMSHDIIVKQHGGRIDVETEPGAFTEFIITLPRAAT